MSKNMARLYEKAWNQIVDKCPEWKKNLIINNFPYDDPADKRVADEVVKEAIKLAESWEWEESHILTGQN
jgi:hypothetical protein